MENIKEEDAQDMVNSIMPQLIKEGFMEPAKFSGFEILMPQCRYKDPDAITIPDPEPR